ncbi:hypothetical protein SEA_TINALIN_71 [Gordonia phage TinaLin]|uniref:DUF6378 domain-containing protein n=1 Tax=Gordonia phage TinaLin TaxID=2797324 RepID=A0A7T7GTG4_9CAUD|nr:phosphofructokinase [Gordonia phage TinaLin]QQM15159.1 hypothetical protein SEA_TINALIN_71 [Gordonia phage TinaLin]
MNKGDILAKASELVNGNRDKDYGDAKTNHQRIADMWSVVLGKTVEPHEVAACMVLLKVARLVETPDHLDSWVDMAGYAGIGGEIATGGKGDEPDPAPKSAGGFTPGNVVNIVDLDAVRFAHNRAVNSRGRL